MPDFLNVNNVGYTGCAGPNVLRHRQEYRQAVEQRLNGINENVRAEVGRIVAATAQRCRDRAQKKIDVKQRERVEVFRWGVEVIPSATLTDSVQGIGVGGYFLTGGLLRSQLSPSVAKNQQDAKGACILIVAHIGIKREEADTSRVIQLFNRWLSFQR